MRAPCAALLCWLALAGSASAQQALAPRAFGVLRLGPIGQTQVQTHAREVAGPSTPAPGLGARLELPVRADLMLGLDLGMLFEGESELRPQSPDGAYELRAEGLLVDLVVSVRPMWRVASDRIELYTSVGAGLSMRPTLSGQGLLSHGDGTSFVDDGFTSELAWGVLVQAGGGGVFWLSKRFAVFFEIAAIARQANADITDNRNGDYLLQITDTQAVVLTGFGARWGAR